MIIFAYNNNVHVNIRKTLYKLLKDHVTSFVNVFKNKTLKKKTFLIIKRVN